MLQITKGQKISKDFLFLSYFFFWFKHFLEARAEIENIFCSFFGGIEDKRKFLLDLLTFNFIQDLILQYVFFTFLNFTHPYNLFVKSKNKTTNSPIHQQVTILNLISCVKIKHVSLST